MSGNSATSIIDSNITADSPSDERAQVIYNYNSVIIIAAIIIAAKEPT
jgi:hypothetical protein